MRGLGFPKGPRASACFETQLMVSPGAKEIAGRLRADCCYRSGPSIFLEQLEFHSHMLTLHTRESWLWRVEAITKCNSVNILHCLSRPHSAPWLRLGHPSFVFRSCPGSIDQRNLIRQSPPTPIPPQGLEQSRDSECSRVITSVSPSTRREIWLVCLWFPFASHGLCYRVDTRRVFDQV